MMKDKKAPIPEKKRLLFSMLLALLAIVSMVAASVAWFTIADYTKVRSMSMEITSGTNLRFDLDSHEIFDDYVKTLSFAQIAERMKKEKGFDMRRSSLEPVTTSDQVTFFYEDGKEVPKDKGAYLEFVLHFMATQDMVVHLTSSSADGQGGSAVRSTNRKLPDAMRISFTTSEGTYIYDPGLGDQEVYNGREKTFGLAEEENMILSDKNSMFKLIKNVDKPVTVRIWLEGNDPACTDELRNADYQISLRFIGTDEENQVLDGARH